MKAKRWFVFLGLLLTVSVILTSCVPSTTPATTQPVKPTQALAASATPAPTSPPSGTITFYQPATASGTVQDLIDCRNKYDLQPFMQANPTITVKALPIPTGDLYQVVKTQLAGGGGPDIISEFGTTTAAGLAAAGLTIPLDKYAQQYGWSTRFAGWAYQASFVNGKLYMLPDQIETLVLWYDKVSFSDHGWTPPKTIDELNALGKAVQAAGMIPFASGGHGEWGPMNEWFVGAYLNHVPQVGPTAVYEALTGKRKWTDPQLTGAIQLLADHMKNGWYAGGLDKYMALTFADRDGQMTSGKAPMFIEGTWTLPELTKAYQDYNKTAKTPKDFSWAPVPSASGKAIYDLSVGNTYMINKNSKYPDAAAKYLDWRFSPKIVALLWDKCGVSAGPVPFDKSLTTDLDQRWVEILAAADEAARAGNFGYTTWTHFPPKTDAYLISEIEKVWTGTMTVDQFMKGMDDTFAPELSSGAVPAIPSP